MFTVAGLRGRGGGGGVGGGGGGGGGGEGMGGEGRGGEGRGRAVHATACEAHVQGCGRTFRFELPIQTYPLSSTIATIVPVTFTTMCFQMRGSDFNREFRV